MNERMDLTNKQATHGRIFQEIVVEYPSINTYPEYKGKPYFSIKYTENGQGFIGYGTYKPEVLSKYLKEYFMPSLQTKESTEIHACDCISRQVAIDALCAICGDDCDKSEFVYNAPQDEQVILCPEHYCLCTLPSTQLERKRGQWILVKGSNGKDYHKCSECLHTQDITGVKNYCPVCGTEMRSELDD